MEKALSNKGSFVVKESKFLNYLLMCFFIVLFIGVLFTMHFENNRSRGVFIFLDALILSGSVFFFIKGKQQRVIILINQNGIYYKGNLITNWTNFLNAFIKEQEGDTNSRVPRSNNKFEIRVIYFNEQKACNYSYAIVMPGIQNKSEYEVIAAKDKPISFYAIFN